MEDYKLKVGQKIQLTTNSSFYKNIYESKILKLNSTTIEIATPYYKGLYVPLNIGFVLSLRIFTGQGVFSFNSEVIDRNLDSHSVIVTLPNYSKEQLRPKTENFEPTQCKFITVTSGKGGVGKTSFIINYAIALASLGKRVILMDADLGMANIDVLLKISSSFNIVDIIEGNKKINDIIVEAPGGIHFIAGGTGIQEISDLSRIQFNRIIDSFEYLERRYDYVLIDTGAGLSRNVTNFIFASDESIIITTPEPHAITDAYSIIKVILEENRYVNLKLLINKCENHQEGKEVLTRICGVVRNFLNYALIPIGFMLESRAVGKSIKEQIPFMLSYPNSDIANCIKSLAENEVYGEKNTPQENSILSFVNKFKQLFMSG